MNRLQDVDDVTKFDIPHANVVERSHNRVISRSRHHARLVFGTIGDAVLRWPRSRICIHAIGTILKRFIEGIGHRRNIRDTRDTRNVVEEFKAIASFGRIGWRFCLWDIG